MTYIITLQNLTLQNFRFVLDILPLVLLIAIDNFFGYPKKIVEGLQKTAGMSTIINRCELIYFLITVAISSLITGYSKILTSNADLSAILLGFLWAGAAFLIIGGAIPIITEKDPDTTNYKTKEFILKHKISIIIVVAILILITELV
jgi:hypothetical protein